MSVYICATLRIASSHSCVLLALQFTVLRVCIRTMRMYLKSISVGLYHYSVKALQKLRRQ